LAELVRLSKEPRQRSALDKGKVEVRNVKKRLFALTVLALSVALVLPSSALAAYKWTKSPVNPMVKGGVHSTAKFRQIMTSSGKVRSAMRKVIKADKYPSWVFDAAVKKAAAGDIHSASLARGSRIGAMAFGLKKTRIVNDTVWAGRGRLPYYFVNASKTVVQGGFNVTTTYKVCLAKTCANPFVLGRRVTRTAVVAQTPQVYSLYVDTFATGEGTMRIGGIEVTGTVGAQSVSATTTDTAPTLIGQFPAGTAYNLTQGLLPFGLVPFTPSGGIFTGTMPAHDLTLEFVNGLEFETEPEPEPEPEPS
jgi:hypothetical protein